MTTSPNNKSKSLSDFWQSPEEIDCDKAKWDSSLSRVIADESFGDITATMDRLVFESPLTMAQRYLEPNGFEMNLENILAVIDSMKIGVITTNEKNLQQDGRPKAKTMWPAVYIKQPSRSSKGVMLSKFYQEVSKYESELSRLQQSEAASKSVAQSAIKDDTGKAAVSQLTRQNDFLKNELDRVSKKLRMVESAIEAVPVSGSEILLPSHIKLITIRSIDLDRMTILCKSDQGQFTCSLKLCNGLPKVGSRAVVTMDGVNVKGVQVFDPIPTPFEYLPVKIVAVDGHQMKVEMGNRNQLIIEDGREFSKNLVGTTAVVRMIQGVVIDIVSAFEFSQQNALNEVFEKQTLTLLKDQLRQHQRKQSKSQRRAS